MHHLVRKIVPYLAAAFLGATGTVTVLVTSGGFDPFRCDRYVETAQKYLRENEKLDEENRTLKRGAEIQVDADRGQKSSVAHLQRELTALKEQTKKDVALREQLEKAKAQIAKLEKQVEASELAQVSPSTVELPPTPNSCTDSDPQVRLLSRKLARCQRQLGSYSYRPYVPYRY